jgi:hypothetical protein
MFLELGSKACLDQVIGFSVLGFGLVLSRSHISSHKGVY